MTDNARGADGRRRDRDRYDDDDDDDDDDDAAEDLGLVDGLVQLSFLVQRVLGEIVGRHDLSIIQARLLGILRDRAPTMQELAAHLHLDKSSMTGLVDRAERRGLVERTPSSSDRRAVHVALTKAGRDLTRTVTKEVERDVSALASRLTREGRNQLSLSASALVTASRGRRPAAG